MGTETRILEKHDVDAANAAVSCARGSHRLRRFDVNYIGHGTNRC